MTVHFPARVPKAELEIVTGRFTTGAGGDVAASTPTAGNGFTVSRQANPGVYRVTLGSRANKIVSANAQIMASTLKDQAMQVKQVATDGSYVDFHVYTPSTTATTGTATSTVDVSYRWHKDTADGAASTATSEEAFAYVGGTRTITRCWVTSGGTITADNSNYARLRVYRRRAGVQVVVAELNTQISGGGSWVAWTPIDMGALTTSAIASGDILTMEITKTGTGVTVPRCNVTVLATGDFTSASFGSAATAAALSNLVSAQISVNLTVARRS